MIVSSVLDFSTRKTNSTYLIKADIMNTTNTYCNPMNRQYRIDITTAGQSSPSYLSDYVVDFLKKSKIARHIRSEKRSIVDVGCGLGKQMKRIAYSMPNQFSRICGIDWSPATIKMHEQQSNSIYDSVVLCASSDLPFEDKEFDVSLSMENIEHLYVENVIKALKEMSRVSKYIIITTPLPCDCIKKNFIYKEIIDSSLDEHPLSKSDYICMESAIHKSTLSPQSMVEAGFYMFSCSHGCYFAKSDDIDFESIKYIGINESSIDEHSCDFRNVYTKLLARSAKIDDEIKKNPLFQFKKPRGLLRKLQKIMSCDS